MLKGLHFHARFWSVTIPIKKMTSSSRRHGSSNKDEQLHQSKQTFEENLQDQEINLRTKVVNPISLHYLQFSIMHILWGSSTTSGSRTPKNQQFIILCLFFLFFFMVVLSLNFDSIRLKDEKENLFKLSVAILSWTQLGCQFFYHFQAKQGQEGEVGNRREAHEPINALCELTCSSD